MRATFTYSRAIATGGCQEATPTREIGAGIAATRHENAVRKVQARNESVPEWRETLEDWEQECRELQGIWLPPL